MTIEVIAGEIFYEGRKVGVMTIPEGTTRYENAAGQIGRDEVAELEKQIGYLPSHDELADAECESARLQEQYNDLEAAGARLDAEHEEKIADMQDEIDRLTFDNSKLIEENERLENLLERKQPYRGSK